MEQSTQNQVQQKQSLRNLIRKDIHKLRKT